MRITAVTKDGTIVIEAEKGHRRTYSWKDCRKSVRLYARPERWKGSLGLYNPGAGITWWSACDGIRRAVVEEGQQHFKTDEEALEWIKAWRGLTKVYRSDGLVVEFSIDARPHQLSVDVWQVMVTGEKPTHLEGADDSSIRVSWGNSGGKGRPLGYSLN